MSELHNEPPPEEKSLSNDPLGCLFDVFTYILVLMFASSIYIWYKAGTGELPAISAETITPELIRIISIIFAVFCLACIILIRVWGFKLYRKMLAES